MFTSQVSKLIFKTGTKNEYGMLIKNIKKQKTTHTFNTETFLVCFFVVVVIDFLLR